MFFWLFILALTLFKVWLSQFLPLLGDEAYYSLWSQHLALSYVDHPPLIAYINWLINHILGQSEFAIRLTAIIGILLATGLVYLIGKEAFGKKAGLASAFLFNLIPTFLAGGMFLTPEQPLLFFWLLATYLALKLIKTQKARYWLLLGIIVGLGLLSKFPMLLFFPGILLFLILSKENRRWLTRVEPYLGLIFAMLVFSPVIYWNIQQHFPSFVYHGSRLSSPHYFENILTFFVLQFLMYSPPLFTFLCRQFFYGFWENLKTTDNRSLLLSSLSLPAFFAFLFACPFTQIGGHWTSIIYPGLIIVFCYQLLSKFPNPLYNRKIWFSLGVIVLLDVLFISYYAFLFPVPAEIKGNEYRINSQLEQYIKDNKPTYVYSNQMGVGSLVAFYGKTEVYLPKGYWKQFDIWGEPVLKKGESIIYFAFDAPLVDSAVSVIETDLRKQFHSVKKDPHIRLFAKDSDITLKTQIFICRGYQAVF
ncbi:MAG: glycosyltransferase family 39 protein [Candidatus Margulisbacteria bacterium]|nr:glycosyltransferase family 39 protein [Candidatus Margulisiibacteriota bacterium]